MTAHPYSVGPLAKDLPFGATVTSLRLEHLKDETTRKALFNLWIDKGVLLFRGENSSEMHVELSRCFGPLEQHVLKETWVEGHPELVDVKYYPDNGTCYEVDGKILGGWLPWHSDLFYTDKITHGAVLRPVQLPTKGGGQTGFIDKISAYERLPIYLKERIEKLHVVYNMNHNAEHQRYGRTAKDVRFVKGAKSFIDIGRREYQYPRILHPMVIIQPETGYKILNISPWFALGIYEIGGPEGEKLLHEIVGYCLDDAQVYLHEWQMDDMLAWDNWRVLHSAKGVAPDDTRVMRRTTISGDYALGRKLDKQNDDLPIIDV